METQMHELTTDYTDLAAFAIALGHRRKSFSDDGKTVTWTTEGRIHGETLTTAFSSNGNTLNVNAKSFLTARRMLVDIIKATRRAEEGRKPDA